MSAPIASAVATLNRLCGMARVPSDAVVLE